MIERGVSEGVREACGRAKREVARAIRFPLLLACLLRLPTPRVTCWTRRLTHSPFIRSLPTRDIMRDGKIYTGPSKQPRSFRRAPHGPTKADHCRIEGEGRGCEGS